MKRILSVILSLALLVSACFSVSLIASAETVGTCKCEDGAAVLKTAPYVSGKVTVNGELVRPTEFTPGQNPVFTISYNQLTYCTTCKTYTESVAINDGTAYNWYVSYDEPTATGSLAKANMGSTTSAINGSGTADGTDIVIDIAAAFTNAGLSDVWNNTISAEGYAGSVCLRVTFSDYNSTVYDGSVIYNRGNIKTSLEANNLKPEDWETKMSGLVSALGEINNVTIVTDGSTFLPSGAYTYDEINTNAEGARAALTADLDTYRTYWKEQQSVAGTTIAILDSSITNSGYKVYEVYVEAGGSDLEDVDFGAANYVDDGKYLPTVGYLTVPVDSEGNPKTDLGLSVSYQGYGFYNPDPTYSSTEIYFATNNMGYPLSMDQNILLWMQNYQYGCRNYDKEFSDTLNASFETSYYNAVVRRGLRAVQFVQYYALDKDVLTSESAQLKNVSVSGGSFGGFQALAVAGLDDDVTYVNATYPWMCDVAGKNYGRVGSNFMPSYIVAGENETLVELDAFKYFDSVFFADSISTNALVRINDIGMGDACCPVSGIAALENALKDKGIDYIAMYNQDDIHGDKTTTLQGTSTKLANLDIKASVIFKGYNRALRNQYINNYYNIKGIEQSKYGENNEKNRLTITTEEAAALLGTTGFAGDRTLDSIIVDGKNYSVVDSYADGLTVESIASGGLKSCPYLEELKFENGAYVKRLGASAFQFDYKLSALELPYGLETVDGWAIQYCGIKSLKLPCAGPEGASLSLNMGSFNPFANTASAYAEYASNVAIDENGKGGLETVEFTYDSSKTYGTLAFVGAAAGFPYRILWYKEGFYWLSTSVIIDEDAPSASSITSAWNNDSSEEYYKIPVNPDAVISFVPNEDTADVDDDYTMIFGKGVKSVSYSRVNAAANASGIDSSKVTKLIVRDGVTLIDSTNSGQTEGVFYNFRHIAEIEYEDGGYFKYIGKNAFYLNDALEHLYLPTGLEGIGNSAIRQLKKIKSITFAPATEKGICFGDYCLAEMNDSDKSSTINITFEEQNPNIPYTRGVEYANGTTDNGVSIFGWGTPPYRVTVDFGTKLYTDFISIYSGLSNFTRVNSQYSFDNANKRLTISSSVTALNKAAFDSCGVTKADVKEIYIKGKVSVSGDTTFNGFTNLERLTFDEANGACITTLEGNGAFKGSGLTVLDLPVGLTLVGKYALNESAIRTLVIPAASKDAEGNIVPIQFQYGAFSNGSAPLYTVTFEGTEADSYKSLSTNVNAVWTGTACAYFYKNDAVFAAGGVESDLTWTMLKEFNTSENNGDKKLTNPSVYMKWDDEKAQSIMMITGGTADAPATVTQSLINAAGAGYNAKISGAIVLIDGVVALGTSAFNTTDGIPIITDLQYTDGSYITSTGQATFSNKQFRVENLVFPEGLTSFGDYTFQQNTYVKTITFPSTLKKLPNNAFCADGSYGIGKVTWYTDTIESLKALSTVATSAETTEFVVTNLACYNAVVAAKKTYSTDTFWSKLAVTSITGTNGAAISEFTQGVDDNGGLTISGYTGTATSVVLPKGATKVTALKDGITEITANEDVTIENGVLAAGTVINGSLDYTELCSYALNKDNAVFLMVSDEEAATLKEGDYTGDKTVDIRDHARLKKHLKDVSGSTTTVGLLKQAAKENCDESGNINANAVVALCKAIITAIAG